MGILSFGLEPVPIAMPALLARIRTVMAPASVWLISRDGVADRPNRSADDTARHPVAVRSASIF